MTGTEPHDLSEADRGDRQGDGRAERARAALSELVPNFNTFFAAFAAQSPSLSATVAELPSALHQRRARLRRARCRVPARSAPSPRHHPRRQAARRPTVAAALPWIEQVQASLAPSELGGVAKGLGAAAPTLAQLQQRTAAVLQADRSVQQVPDQSVLPGRQHQAAGRLEHLGRGRVQGILVRAHGPGRDRPELRRQRPLPTVPGRQQRPDAASRDRRRSSAPR